MAPTKEIDMSEFTTMAIAAHRVTAIESLHPASAMAYEFAFQRRLARRARWSKLRTRRSVAARREAALSPGC